MYRNMGDVIKQNESELTDISHVQTVLYLRLLVIYEGIIIIFYQRNLSTREKKLTFDG